MKALYPIDQIEILNKIKYVTETIIQRLYSTFDSIEQESKLIEEEAYKKSSQNFNPETMDESHGVEEAYFEGVNHYLIQNEMKDEFLNSSITWIFHLFEKDCTRIFNTENGDLKKSELERLNIDVSESSLWHKCNSELRFIANTIKHGKGASSNNLRAVRPELFKNSMTGRSEDKIQLRIEEIKEYAQVMTEFWEAFFKKALPVYD